jgi:hypothetical protein
METNITKFLQQREIGGKKKLDPETHAELVMAQLQLEYDAHHQVSQPDPAFLGQMKKGGMVNKTGLYKLHKGELVVPSKNVSKVKKALSRRK